MSRTRSSSSNLTVGSLRVDRIKLAASLWVRLEGLGGGMGFETEFAGSGEIKKLGKLDLGFFRVW